jgi:hypothetical protein
MGLFTRTRRPVMSRMLARPWHTLGVTYLPTIRGESHYQPELRALRRKGARWTARLVREPDNQFDANAVSVWVGEERVAYLARQEAAELASRLDDLARRGWAIEFPVTLVGGDTNRPSIGVFAD